MQEIPGRCSTWDKTYQTMTVSPVPSTTSTAMPTALVPSTTTMAEQALQCPCHPTQWGIGKCAAFPASPLQLSTESSPFLQPTLPIHQERELLSEASLSLQGCSTEHHSPPHAFHQDPAHNGSALQTQTLPIVQDKAALPGAPAA